MKCVFSMVLVLVLVLVAQSQAQSSCSTSLSSLNVCTPFVVGGSTSNPSAECCSALQAIDHDCMCSTIQIASRIPVQCNLPPLSCGN